MPVISKGVSVCVCKGLDKLMEASESVAKLSQDLAVKEKELAVASVKADEVSWHPHPSRPTRNTSRHFESIFTLLCNSRIIKNYLKEPLFQNCIKK